MPGCSHEGGRHHRPRRPSRGHRETIESARIFKFGRALSQCRVTKTSDVELVVARSIELEKLLELHYGASGRGLGGRAKSCKKRLPTPVFRSIMRLAAERNAVIHDGHPLRSRKTFIRLADEVRAQLKPRRAPRPKRQRPERRRQDVPPRRSKPTRGGSGTKGPKVGRGRPRHPRASTRPRRRDGRWVRGAGIVILLVAAGTTVAALTGLLTPLDWFR